MNIIFQHKKIMQLVIPTIQWSLVSKHFVVDTDKVTQSMSKLAIEDGTKRLKEKDDNDIDKATRVVFDQVCERMDTLFEEKKIRAYRSGDLVRWYIRTFSA